MAYKGMTMTYYHPEDLSFIGDNLWWWDWGSHHYDDPNYVPMSYAGEDPLLPPEYSGYILLFNEPDNVPPYGGPLTPQESAVKYLALREKYPLAKWVVGNSCVWGIAWLIRFKDAIRNTPVDVWGLHGYVEAYITPQMLMDWWMLTCLALGGGRYWVTEWADTQGNIENNEILENWINEQSWIDRYSLFTNRVMANEVWWPPYWKNISLFDYGTGKPTRIGMWYAGKQYITYMPVMAKGE